MSIYKQIQVDIKTRHNISVDTCHIAHVKELNGLPLRKAHNRRSPEYRVKPCPEHKRPLIEESMRRFGMLQRDRKPFSDKEVSSET